MNKIIGSTCYVVVIFAALSASSTNGAASKTELQQLYYRFFQQKDEQKLATLVYWEGVERRERDGFFRSLRNDLKYRLQNVKFVPLDTGVKLEYTLDGVTYMPVLPPIGRMVASYEDQDNVKNPTTSYLVGVKDGRYYIDLASPKRNN
jgi:hypothetical protein